MTQAWTVVWAQWRSYRNYASQSSVIVASIVGVIWYGIWTAAGFAAAVLLSRANADMAGTVSGILLLMSLYWQLIPIMMAASGMSLDLNKLKCYPIPVRDLFTIEVLLRTTASMEMLIILTGGAIGVLLNPHLPAWGALAAIPFAAMQLMFALGLRDAILRLLSKRRLREISTIFFLMVYILPRVLSGRPGLTKWLETQFSSGGFSGPIPIWPWTATGHLLMGQQAGIASVALLCWTGVAGVFALWQFRRTLEFDAEAAKSAGENRANPERVSLMERFYRLPSAMLGDPLAAMVEKESRYMARSSRFRMVFLSSCVFGVFISRTMFRESTSLWAPNYLVIEASYAMLVLGDVCIWNVFGFDRSAAQLYFLAPMRFSQVLIAKNLAAALWIGIQFLMTLALCAALRFPVTLDRAAEAVATTVVIALFQMAFGNYVAVSSPRAMDPDSSWRSRSPGGMQFLFLLIFPLTLVPVALAYLARWALASDLAFYGMLAILGAIGFVVYRVALESTVRYAEEQKEQMVSALSADHSPIAS